MSFSSKLLYTISVFLFINSAYSSYQFNQLIKLQSLRSAKLPLDVRVEAIIASLLMLIGSLLSLKNSNSSGKRHALLDSSNVIKGYDTQILKPITMSLATIEDEVQGFCFAEEIENGASFINISKSRELVKQWINEGGDNGQQEKYKKST